MRRVLLGIVLMPIALGFVPKSQGRSLTLDETEPSGSRKCGTSARVGRLSEIGKSSVQDIVEVLARPSLNTSILSGDGRFRVHFDTTGLHEPAFLDGTGSRIVGTARAFADSTAAIFDRAWRYEVATLGYSPPPGDGGQGGDTAYDVYVVEQEPGLFGEMKFEGNPLPGGGNERYQSYIVIDNDFRDLRTAGLAGLRITAAHELFHAIQVGAYGMWSTKEFYLYELSSVWMEEMAYPGVNDYVFDIGLLFSSFRTASLATYSAPFWGYERGLFGLFLTYRYGTEAMRTTWENIRQHRALDALDATLKSLRSSLRRAYAEFGLWNYFTSDRADTVRYYPEGYLYPRVAPLMASNVAGVSTTVSYPFEPLSQGHFHFASGSDTVAVIVTNVELRRAMGGPIGPVTATVAAGTRSLDGPEQALANGMRIGFPAQNAADWEVEIVDARTGSVARRVQYPVFPNPWILADQADLFVPVDDNLSERVKVDFITSGLEVVAAGEHSSESVHGRVMVRIPSQSLSRKLASGIYAVRVQSDHSERLWKVAIVR